MFNYLVIGINKKKIPPETPPPPPPGHFLHGLI